MTGPGVVHRSNFKSPVMSLLASRGFICKEKEERGKRKEERGKRKEESSVRSLHYTVK
jgi:hypothetical protein